MQKLPANAGNFTCGSHAKRPHAQFTCVTCSLPVKTGEFTGVYTASALRRIHANCLQAHLNLPDYGYFICLITGILQVILHAELMQIFPRLAFKIACFCKQKYMQFAGKNTRIAGKNTRQTQAKITANASENTCTIAGKDTSTCPEKHLQLQAICYHTAG